MSKPPKMLSLAPQFQLELSCVQIMSYLQLSNILIHSASPHNFTRVKCKHNPRLYKDFPRIHIKLHNPIIYVKFYNSTSLYHHFHHIFPCTFDNNSCTLCICMGARTHRAAGRRGATCALWHRKSTHSCESKV